MYSSKMQAHSKTNANIQYLWILVMLSLTFQLFDNIPVFDRHYLFWLLGGGLALSNLRPFVGGGAMIWLMIYMLIVGLNFVAGDVFFLDVSTVINEFINLFLPSVLLFSVLRNNYDKFFRCFIIVFGFFLIESTIVSVYADTVYPGLMRYQSNTADATQNAMILRPFVMLGLSDYKIPHAMSVIIPGVVCLFRCTKGEYRLLSLLLLIACWSLSYASGSFTALMMSTLTLVLSLLVNPSNIKKSKKRIAIVVILLMPVMLIQPLQLYLLKSAQSLFPVENMATNKLTSIEESIVYGDAEGSVESRNVKYIKTLEVISQNLLLGTSTVEIGEHSSIPDRIAVLGILGIIPLFVFLGIQIKYALRHLKGSCRVYYYIGLIAAIIMLTVKNTSQWAMWLSVLMLLPAMLWYCNSNDIKKLCK